MTQFSGYHIQQFNQRCKSLIGEGKIVLTHKEIRDLNSEILDLLISLRVAEQAIAEYKSQMKDSAVLNVELNGGSF
jgi:hypothetical protein